MDDINKHSKINIGKMKCETARCGNTCTVKKSLKTGVLSYRCDQCDKAPYARFGTGEYLAWMEDLIPMPDINIHQAPISDLKQAANTVPPPVKAKPIGIFGEL